jgi:FkbM family methyltransferase
MNPLYRERSFEVQYIGPKTWVWPIADNRLHKWVTQVSHIEMIMKYVKHRQVCVQAGGACGVWPLALSKLFDTVYTFEPFVFNFKALSVNCFDAMNLIAFNAALSDQHGTIGMTWKKGHEDNLGAQFIDGKGPIPTFRLDDLNLDACGLLCLDVEGAEFPVLQGGRELIARHRPTIMLEDAGHDHRFGVSFDTTAAFLHEFGYRAVDRMRDDVVFECPA